MTNEIIFYTQIASVVAFITGLFGLYRVLVAQKDSLIELLREQIRNLERDLAVVGTQSPDALVDSLASRVEAAKSEIVRLRSDVELNASEIAMKEDELRRVRDQLANLLNSVEDYELVCPHCRAPLLHRHSHRIFGHAGGREVEADIEVVEYECGLVLKEGEREPLSRCGRSNTVQNSP